MCETDSPNADGFESLAKVEHDHLTSEGKISDYYRDTLLYIL